MDTAVPSLLPVEVVCQVSDLRAQIPGYGFLNAPSIWSLLCHDYDYDDMTWLSADNRQRIVGRASWSIFGQIDLTSSSMMAHVHMSRQQFGRDDGDEAVFKVWGAVRFWYYFS